MPGTRPNAIKTGLLYGSTAVLSLAVLITIYAPANIAFQLFGAGVSNVPETSIYRIGGTIWQGSADVQFRDFPLSEINWELKPLPLLRGVADVKIIASGFGHEVSAGLLLVDNTVHLQRLNGFLHSDYINQVGVEYGLRFTGNLQLKETDLTIENNWIKEISGQLHWTGGQMRHQLESGQQVVNLPPLDGELSIDEELTLNVTHDRLPVLSFVLQPSGWVTLKFRARVFGLAGLSWPTGSDVDDIVLTIEEKIL